MLASVGFLLGELFHPMWGGGLDLPSVIAFQASHLTFTFTRTRPRPRTRTRTLSLTLSLTLNLTLTLSLTLSLTLPRRRRCRTSSRGWRCSSSSTR